MAGGGRLERGFLEGVERREDPDFHSLHWLLYAYLQQGRVEDAQRLLAIMRDSLANVANDDMRNLVFGAYTQATMAATFLVETVQWNRAMELLVSQQTGRLHRRVPAASSTRRSQPWRRHRLCSRKG